LDDLVALIQPALVGWPGVHRFYPAKKGPGLLHLFTAGLFGIGWICDWCTLNAQRSVIHHSRQQG